MARGISENNSRLLWTEVLVSQIKNKNSTISNSIDDVSGDVDIANLFSNKYSVLCNSVAFEQSAWIIYYSQMKMMLFNTVLTKVIQYYLLILIILL